MPIQDSYKSQVDLLIRCLPAVAQVDAFALKGGTAINLFHLNMPRLSVDIDLTYLPDRSRDASIADIRAQLQTIADEIGAAIPRSQTNFSDRNMPKLFVQAPSANIKIEPSVNMRGSLFPPIKSDLCTVAQEFFEAFVSVQMLDIADLYAGKLCAALDRQHPRDLFDVMQLQASDEISDQVRQAFVAYLAGHNRPIAELLAPEPRPIKDLFANQFEGMTRDPVTLTELEMARTHLFEWAATALTNAERQFLLSIKQGDPVWEHLPFENLDRWPAIQWKLRNIRRMDPEKHKEAMARLREVLGI
ncbi:MAG: nucleotidyl transferase AbiEii/AbiGii toxin family protein [Rhodospirillaceae bacterium]|nr:nucleotidyl transferase AbiEii/AbiGii toxin family protein [Rhodospirillaceae bacterium]